MKVNGVCNSTTTSTSYAIAAPPTNLCTSGIATTLQQGSTSNPTGYWTWNCTGSNDGLSPSCAADLKVVNGVCNATTTNPTNGYTTAAPPTDLCTSGTASTLIQGSASNPTGYWTWNCAGSSGGTNSACTANLKINGVCGTANKNYYTYSPSTYGSDTFCASGTLSNTPVFPTSAAQTWYCNGSYGGTNATCKSHYCVEDKSAWPANWSSKCSEAGGTMVDYDVNHYACPGLVATWRTQCGGGSGLGGSVPYYYYSKDINAGKTATFAGYYISNLCGFFHWGSGKVSAMAPDEGFWTTLTNPDGTTTPYFANIVTPGVQRIWVCN